MAYVVYQHPGNGTSMSKGNTKANAYEKNFTLTASTSPGGSAASLTGGFYSSMPTNAVILSAKFNMSCSVNSPASSKNKFYFLKTQDGTATFFDGNPYKTTTNQSEWKSSSGYYKGTNGGEVSFSGGWSYFPGKSSLAIISKVSHQTSDSANVAYYRGLQIIAQFYTPCSDPSGVTATGGLKSLSGSWTLGSAGIDDSISHEVCYSTSQTWNASTAVSTTSTSASWTITTAGTYYVGVRSTGSRSGTHNPVWSAGVKVYTFTPTLVTQGNKILASDYNQIRTAYSTLTALTASSSVIDDANITAVKNLSSGVSSATAGAVVTADFFNNSVLKKIT